MRVISGTAGRRKLVSPTGMDVRPTTDRIKETLFNILAPYIYESEFLDLFAGSGGIGIEALSRGAETAVFVDNNNMAVNCVRKNLEITGLEKKAEVLRMDAQAAVSRLYSQRKTFDIIFLDPPYRQELEKNILLSLEKYKLLKDDGMIIVEASSDTEFGYLEDSCFKITREKKYGSNKHLFIAYK